MKAFIIYLDTVEVSKRLAEESLRAAKDHGIDAVLYQGVHGGKDASSKLTQYNLELKKHKNRDLTKGEIGCFLSHYELWLKCIALNEPIIILEHDGIFIRPIPEDILDNFTDVVHLDPLRSVISPINLSSQYQDFVRKDLTKKIEYFYARPNGTDVAGEYLYGAYGYCIKPQAANKLINFVKNNGVHPADVVIGKDVVDLKSTTATIVKLHDFYTSGNAFTAVKNSLTSPLSDILEKELK